MATDATLSAALKKAREGLPTIVSNIQSRPDYAKRPELAETITLLNNYNLNLLTAEARPILSETEKESLIEESSQTVQPALASLINANLVMSKMGQLNTNRTISPTMALNNNKAMESEQAAIDNLIAQLKVPPAPPPPPPSDAVLKKLEVSGLEQTKNGLYYQFYSKDQSARVKAVTEPNLSEDWGNITWQGGEKDFSGANNLRAISLDKLTKQGSPVSITAKLNGGSRSVDVAVVPNLLSLEVVGATNDGNGSWSADSEAPVIVTATINPDSHAAYQFISWTGGEPVAGKGNNIRQVDLSTIQPGSKGLPVSAAIKVS